MKPLTTMKVVGLALIVAFLLPTMAWGALSFTQLDDDMFIISHRIKIIGSRGKAMKMVYTKSSSLCIAAGFSHFKILDQESEAGQQYQAANASIRVQYFLEDDEERISCKRNADPKYVEQAQKKLRKMNYEPPAKAEEEDSTQDKGGS